MVNAARLLLEMLDSWEGPENRPVETRRDLGRTTQLDFWLGHARAVEYLREIERELHAIQEAVPDAEADAYLTALVPLYQAVFGFEPRWGGARGGATPVPAISATARTDLRRIAGFLATNRVGFAVSKEARVELQAQFDELAQIITEAGHLSEIRRGYVLELLQRARAALDDSRYSDSQLRDLLAQLEAVVIAAAMDAAAEPKFRRRAMKVALSIATLIATTFGTAVVEQTFTPEISSIGQEIRELVGLPAAEDEPDSPQDVAVGSDSN